MKRKEPQLRLFLFLRWTRLSAFFPISGTLAAVFSTTVALYSVSFSFCVFAFLLISIACGLLSRTSFFLSLFPPLIFPAIPVAIFSSLFHNKGF
jgi:hypothetical protein